ncbi:hypothetical protein [Ancylomarina subtilis]|nr:hypothetical protein [Ancylomarina subtilis]
MKKLLLVSIIVIFYCCSKEDSTSKMENLVVYSYYTTAIGEYPYDNLYPASDGPITSADFYFFNAKDIVVPIQKDIITIDNLTDYSDYKSEVVGLLETQGKLKLSNGSVVNSIQIDIRNLDNGTYKRGYASTVVDAHNDDEWNDVLTKNAISLSIGEYLVVVIHGGHPYYCSEGYSYKTITITKDMPTSDRYITIVFPWDMHYKGYFDWIDNDGFYN